MRRVVTGARLRVWRLALSVACVGSGALARNGGAAEAVQAQQAVSGFSAEWKGAEREIVVRLPRSDGEDHEVRLRSDVFAKLETGADVNEPGIIYLPPPKNAEEVASQTDVAENVFFSNELVTTDGWELVARFDENASGTWTLNGRFSRLDGALSREVTIAVGELEPGENLLHVRSDRARVPELFFRRKIARSGEAATLRVRVTPANWSGRVELLRGGAGGEAVRVGVETIVSAELRRREISWGDEWWRDRGALNDAALAVGRSLLNSQVTTEGSAFRGGFHLVYDPQVRGHRMAHWLWAWGPSIDLLLRLSALEAARADGSAERFRAAAVAAGERSLRFGMMDPAHPAYGVSTVRWEPSRATPLGWAEYISTADSLFLAGWGWMSLHETTGRPEFLDRTKLLVAAAERLMGQYPVVPQDWIVERDGWTPHTLDESVFGMIGFRRLFEATGERAVAAAGKRFLDSHLEHMGRESGLLMRAWMREEDKEIWDPDIKGHAWVIEGYLDAYRLSGDARYLALADELAQKVIECQAADGGWTYLFKKPEAGDPIDDKGTAIWAYLFYDLYKSTKNPAHLAAARRALGWCLRHQYRGEDPNLDGAIFHENSMAYVRRRPMSILYSTTFFGHALLEELALAKARQN